jgi:DNA-binding transcriptional regulator YhcF (GntR family)
LRALLKRFYSYRDGTCYPSYDAIAEAAGCCRETVRTKLRILAELGIIETIRRKVVATFTSRAHRARFDVTQACVADLARRNVIQASQDHRGANLRIPYPQP